MNYTLTNTPSFCTHTLQTTHPFDLYVLGAFHLHSLTHPLDLHTLTHPLDLHVLGAFHLHSLTHPLDLHVLGAFHRNAGHVLQAMTTMTKIANPATGDPPPTTVY